MKKIILVLILIFQNNTIISQKYELGRVTIEELKEKVCPKDSTANAAILFEKGKTFFIYTQGEGFKINTEVEMKIKIYKKEGYEWANEKVKYYIGNAPTEGVKFSKAITYNLVNGQIEKTKLKSEGEFIEKANKFWGIKKITLPNVKEGSIIEYKYIIESPYYSTFPTWEFQKTIPVIYSEYSTEIPEYFYYNNLFKGFLSPTVTKNSVTRTITLNHKDIVQNGLNMMKYQTTTDNINYNENQTTYVLENVPALKDESYVNSVKNYISSVEHELTGKKMPQSQFESYANSWEDVVKKIYDNDDFGPQLKKDNYFENDIKTLVAGINNRDEKIMIIFNYVKSRMNWNGYYGYSCNDGVKKAYQEKVGNVAEINLMLVAMLRYADINANPIIISTRSNGIALFPSRNAFNYVIAGVEIENDVILLDATSKNSLPNILPARDLNWMGRIIRTEGSSSEINLNPKSISRDIVSSILSIDKEGKLQGKIKEQYLDYNAFIVRENNEKSDKNNYVEKLEKKLNNIEISEYTITNMDTLNKPVIETYSFKSNNSVEVIGDKMFFSPLFFFAKKENPFKQEKREYPVDFIFPFEDKYIFNITIPEGYIVETMPTPISLTMSENLATLKYILSNNETQIQISSTLTVNSSIISSDYYEELKAFFGEVVKKESEKIVLKKL